MPSPTDQRPPVAVGHVRLTVSDVGAASNGGASIQIAANGGVFATPSGYKPAGAVSLYGMTTGQAFAARRW